MAEIFGPIGFAFGTIGFIFSTAGTVTEAWENFHEYEEHMGLYQMRLGRFEQKISMWNIFWGSVPLQRDQKAIFEGTKKRINTLCNEMENEVKDHSLTDQGFWRMLRSGKRLKLRDIAHEAKSIPNGLAYALWKKRKLDGWMTRLKEEVEGIDSLSKDELKKRTANHASDNPDQPEINRTLNLEHFVQTLHDFAQELHQQCTSTPTTRGWALGLRPPRNSRDTAEENKSWAKDVKSWSHIAQVDIELVYSLSGDTVREGRLRVGHHRRHAQPSVPSQDGIRGLAAINDRKIERNILDEPRVRTRAIGKLIHEGFFSDPTVRKAWRQDCARLLRGISNWTLLLWNSNWTQELCCYGLQIEEEVSMPNCFQQLFTAGMHGISCPHHPWRLRNLGLVLAQIALTTPFRCTGGLDGLELEEWMDSAWSSIYIEDILERLMIERPNTDKLREAIEFCLTDESSLAKEGFRPGFLFKCIESIHNKILEWCEVELADSYFYDALNKQLTNRQWPDKAYERAQEQQPGPNIALANNEDMPEQPLLTGNAQVQGDAQETNNGQQSTHLNPHESPQQDRNNMEVFQISDTQQGLTLRPSLNLGKSRSEEPELQNTKHVRV